MKNEAVLRPGGAVKMRHISLQNSGPMLLGEHLT